GSASGGEENGQRGEEGQERAVVHRSFRPSIGRWRSGSLVGSSVGRVRRVTRSGVSRRKSVGAIHRVPVGSEATGGGGVRASQTRSATATAAMLAETTPHRIAGRDARGRAAAHTRAKGGVVSASRRCASVRAARRRVWSSSGLMTLPPVRAGRASAACHGGSGPAPLLG